MEFLSSSHEWVIFPSFILLSILFAYCFAPLYLWTLLAFALLFYSKSSFEVSTFYTLLGALSFLALLLNFSFLRAIFISSPIMKLLKALKFLPVISETEKAALDAGIVWTEGELFSGKPNLKTLFKQKNKGLTDEEEAFLSGPVEEVCQKIDDWKIWKKRKIPDEILDYIKAKGFLGMIIPKKYGGLEFSAEAHSEVLMKISSRSLALGITVMVPNSLGPAELLIHYGTKKQKEKYLPKLALGKEIPCFALTEPSAGSDAGSITSEGVLFKKPNDSKIYMRLNWNKRWITLASISTVIGLAFKIRDPDHLISEKEDLGITCALIPSNTEGVILGRRHDPLGVPFYNCPTQGKDVVVDADECIIGGIKRAGQGWSMLMESLAAGRGISLPALSTGGIHHLTRLVSSFSVIRKQFGISIKKFEGVEEPISRIAGACYFMESLRRYTLSALDQNIKPPIVTAMTKYNATEIFRERINDAMDVLGGSGISMGSNNVIAIPYISAPISITVEGANILTRTLIIFGQGLVRAHPYVFKEIEAIKKNDFKAFDKAFWSHVKHVFGNFFRAFILSVTKGFVLITPLKGRAGRYAQKLVWASSVFAFFADIAMLFLGGKLKMKEKLTGRFADILSWMYIGTATLKRYKEDGCLKEDLPFLDYSMELSYSKIQTAFEGILANFDHPFLGWIFKGPLLLLSQLNQIGKSPSDALTQKLVHLITTPGKQRERIIKSFSNDISSLTKSYILNSNKKESLEKDRLEINENLYNRDPLLKLEKAFYTIFQTENLERKLRKEIRKGNLPKKPIRLILDEALEKNLLNKSEYQLIKKAEKLRWECIQVDDFSEAEYVFSNEP